MSLPTSLAGAVMAPDGTAGFAPPIVAPPASDSSIPWLGRAIQAAAPRADVEMWVKILEPHLLESGINTPNQVAAMLGQAAVEAGTDFKQLAESTRYKTAAHLRAMFPYEFSSDAEAQAYIGNDERIACRAYANRYGNGNEASGDGWRFRGSGLLQLTFRANYKAFASSIQSSADQVADWVRQPEGAAASACWYWRTRPGLKAAAEAWNLVEVTTKVTGRPPSDLNRHSDRVKFSDAALKAIQDDSPQANPIA